MPNFEPMFRKSRGQPIKYNGFQLVRYDKFPVENNEILICSIENATRKPNWLQGFCIEVMGYAELDGKILKKGKGVRLLFWDKISPKQFAIKIFTKTGFVWINNLTEIETSYLLSDQDGNPIERYSKTQSYNINGAAMIVEEIERGRRYRCSDTSSAEKPFPFNDIVFSVRKVDSMNLDKAIQNR